MSSKVICRLTQVFLHHDRQVGHPNQLGERMSDECPSVLGEFWVSEFQELLNLSDTGQHGPSNSLHYCSFIYCSCHLRLLNRHPVRSNVFHDHYNKPHFTLSFPVIWSTESGCGPGRSSLLFVTGKMAAQFGIQNLQLLCVFHQP